MDGRKSPFWSYVMALQDPMCLEFTRNVDLSSVVTDLDSEH